jgi:hypothetical protein
MIKVKHISKPIRGFALVIDHKVIKETIPREFYVMVAPNHKNKFAVTIFDEELIKMVVSHPFGDVSREILRLELYPRYSLIKDTNIIQNVFIVGRAADSFDISLEFGFDALDWKRLWSFSEYIEEFSRIVDRDNPLNIREQSNRIRLTEDGLSVSLPESSPSAIIEAEVFKYSGILQSIHESVEASLISKLREDSVVMSFDFPKEVSVACEQYLLYFIQFLKDLGVEASADIQHEAGQVLFAVTPKNKDEALDKIYTALKTYIQIASSPIGGSPDSEDEMAIQRHLANIDHLKSQLRLSYMMVRTQEATIQAQQVTIVNQQRILSGEVLMDSIKNVTPKPEDKDTEEVLGGMAEITKYEGKGFNLNLPEAYRQLRRLFSEKKKE